LRGLLRDRPGLEAVRLRVGVDLRMSHAK